MIHHLTNGLSRIYDAVNAMVNGSVIGKALIAVGSAIVSYFAPIWYLLVICFATTALDMIYGIKVAKKLNQKIESGKNWSGTLNKIKDEAIILALLHGLEWAVMDESGVFLLTGGATVIITLTELWSILENLNTLDPKGPWRMLGKFLKKKGEDYTGIELENDKHTDDCEDVPRKPRKGPGRPPKRRL